MRSNNVAAFATSATLAAVTIVCAIAAAKTAATVALVAYSILAVTSGALSIASITAWLDTRSVDASSYFDRLGAHAGIAIAATYQFVAQTMLQALIHGIADGIGKAVSRKIAGADHTVEYKAV